MGQIERLIGRDVHARDIYAAAVALPHAVIALEDKDQKTTVRADSSASRGAAEETVVDGKILVPSTVSLSRRDRVTLSTGTYAIIATHPRYTVFGVLDHIECLLERMP
ncbi:hypothetical protein NKH72_22315 [Mesorhizobium sp. M0955]|uniref:hypothetical protein n=1 Tax=Mesorhizobium sp. M0955 TaxID=2957033 RepID=UPI0033384720